MNLSSGETPSTGVAPAGDVRYVGLPIAFDDGDAAASAGDALYIGEAPEDGLVTTLNSGVCTAVAGLSLNVGDFT
jgi:hypothetical protein